MRLLSPAGAKDSYFAEFGWIGNGVAAPDANTVWTASAPTLAPGKPVTLSWTNPTGQRFELIVSVDDGYMFTVRQRVANLGTGAVALARYGLVSRAEKRQGRYQLDQSCRADRLPRRQGRLWSRLGNARRGQGRRHPRQPRRLARLHRQILADRARPG